MQTKSPAATPGEARPRPFAIRKAKSVASMLSSFGSAPWERPRFIAVCAVDMSDDELAAIAAPAKLTVV